MRNAKILATCSAVGLCTFGLSAGAEIPDDDQPLEAMIIETNPEARTITVEFEANGSTETLPVAEDAQFTRLGANGLERPISLSELQPGTEVDLEYAEEIDVGPTLHVLFIRES